MTTLEEWGPPKQKKYLGGQGSVELPLLVRGGGGALGQRCLQLHNLPRKFQFEE